MRKPYFTMGCFKKKFNPNKLPLAMGLNAIFYFWLGSLTAWFFDIGFTYLCLSFIALQYLYSYIKRVEE